MEQGQPKKITKKEKFGDVELETIYRETKRPLPSYEGVDLAARGATFSFVAPFNQRTYMAEPGIICEQDVPVKMRDGITIYTDIYRPDGQTKSPLSFPGALSASVRATCQSEWQKWVSRQERSPAWPSSNRPTPAIGATGICRCQRGPPRHRPFGGRCQLLRHPGRPGRL